MIRLDFDTNIIQNIYIIHMLYIKLFTKSLFKCLNLLSKIIVLILQTEVVLRKLISENENLFKKK